MDFKRTSIIIRREYLNKVKKKSFLVITFLAPVLFAALCILPTIIMMKTKEESKIVAVVDNSGLVMKNLENTETITYEDCTGQSVETLKAELKNSDYDAVLSISELDVENQTVTAEVYSNKPLGMDMSENMNNRINSSVEAYRIEQSGVENLKELMASVKAKVKMKTYTLDEEGKETISESGVFMAVSMILGIVIYMFIVLFGGMVMSSVIEEKSSRVVEVLVSSVKATELMFGKIIGIALVALTQFFLWIVLTGAIVGVVGAITGSSIFANSDPAELVQMAGVSGEQADAIVNAVAETADEPEGLEVILSSIKSMPWATIGISFLFLFVFGYMLYASLYAAIGSAVENEADTQQLSLPVTIPILLGFFIAIYAYKAPDSALVFWGSMIPFTSPIVMLARLPFGVPMWQIVLSIALLVGTFAACAWASAKIYKVGILMFGKKSSWKDLWKWLKM